MHLHHQLWIQFGKLCNSLNDDQYSTQCKALNGATIGEHLRHSFEFYQCLLEGVQHGSICYDNRKRNTRLQTDRSFAIEQMQVLADELIKLTATGPLQIHSKETNQASVCSSVERELIYCLDHAIHHQALIKIGLHELGCTAFVSNDFGVAYSTLRYRAQLNSET